jgi:hypothetical protein
VISVANERGSSANTWLLSAVLVCVAAAAGFVGGRATHDAALPAEAVNPSKGGSAGSRFDPATLDTPDPVKRARRFLAMLDGLDAADFPVVAERLHGRGDEWGEFEARLFIWAWSEVDPVDAMAGALEWSRNLRESVSYAAVRAWARADPIAAQEAVRVELQDAKGNLGISLLSGLAYGWAENGDFDGALKLVETRFDSLVHRESLVEMVIEEMLRVRGPAASFAWAEELADRNEDPAFLSIVFRKLGRNAILVEPEATAEWLDRFEGHPSYMNRARRAAALMWARADAPAALAWMTTRPRKDAHRIAGSLTILADWVTRDSSAALKWVREAPPDPVLDEGVARAANQVARKAPRDALEWVALVRDADLRRDTLVVIGSRWVASDPEEASTWMREAGLPEETRQRIEEAAATSSKAGASMPMARPAGAP